MIKDLNSCKQKAATKKQTIKHILMKCKNNQKNMKKK